MVKLSIEAIVATNVSLKEEKTANQKCKVAVKAKWLAKIRAVFVSILL